jgi:hypothetical protein
MRPSVPDLRHAVGVVRGTNGGVVAASTVNVSDTSDPDADVNAHALVFTGTSVSEGNDGQALIDITTGVKSLLNNSGADVALGDVVVNDPTADDAFTTTTTAQFTEGAVGVAQAAIVAGMIGPVLFSGYASIVNVTAAVTRGAFLETSTTAGKATTNATRRAGSFGVVLTGADPAANVLSSVSVLGQQVSTLTTAGTSMTIDVPTIDDGNGNQVLPADGLVMVLMLQRTVSTTPTITGWTRVGATAGFYYYYRVTSSEPATYSASWTSSSQAVALVAVVDGLDTASLVAGSAFDSTTGAASISGLASAYYWALAGVDAQVALPSGWSALLGGTTSSGTSTAAAIVQAVNASVDIGRLDVSFASPVTPGNLLVCVASRRDNVASTGFVLTGTTPAISRNFTAFGPQVEDLAGSDRLVISYRVATGDEQFLSNFSGNYQRARLYEISNAGDPTTFEVLAATLQASSSTKSLGAFAVPGAVQIAGFITHAAAADQSAGTGYTLDYQAAASSHPTFICEHDTAGNTPQITGTAHLWAGMAVGITTGTVSVAAELVSQTFNGTGVTSPFTGAAQNDGLIAFNLKAQDVFVTTQTPDAVIFGWPDRGTNAGAAASLTTISPAQLTANTDDWNPTGLSTASVIRVSTDASRNLTGIVAPATTWALVLENVGGFDLVLKHDVTSTAANRFYCPNDTDVTLQKDSSVFLAYDLTSSRWRVIGGTGGGGTAVWFNVRDYGALGDGTTDDTAACAAATAAAEVAGGVVYFPPGTYKVSGLTIAASKVEFRGDGTASIIAMSSATGNTVTVSAAAQRQFVAIRDLKFAPSVTRTSGAEIAAGWFFNLTIEGVTFNGPGAGFKINSCMDLGVTTRDNAVVFLQSLRADFFARFVYVVRVLDLWVSQVSTDANAAGANTIIIDGGVESSSWNECDFVNSANNDTSGTGAVLTLRATDYATSPPRFNTFQACFFDSHGTGLSASAGKDITFVQCWFSARPNQGALVSGSACENFVFEGCRFENCGNHGLSITNGTDHQVIGCTAVSNDTRAGGASGFNVSGVTGLVFVGNRAYNRASFGGSQDYGLVLVSGVDQFVVTNNDLRGNATGGISNGAGTGTTKIVYNNLPAGGESGPVGTAGGDLSGSYPNPTVAKVQGVAVTDAASTGAVLYKTGAAAATWAVPGGDLSGSWPSPTVAKVNGIAVTGTPSSGQVLTATGPSAADWETPAAGAAATLDSDHAHIDDVLFSGDGATVAFLLPVAPVDAYSVEAFVAGVLTEVSLSGAMLDIATFGSAPGSGTNNIRFDITALVD